MKTLVHPKMRRKITASLLVFCMMFQFMPTATFATDQALGTEAMCLHHAQHTPECGYIEGQDQTSCGFICQVCNQTSEQGQCACLPADGGEIVHLEGCSEYVAPAILEQTEAAQAVLALIDALPTMDEFAAVDTEGEGFFAYLDAQKANVLAAHAAYEALAAEEKAAIDAAYLEKLTVLEQTLAALPMPMAAEDSITIKINDEADTYGGASLQEAVTTAGADLTSITTLTIMAGSVTTNDWNWIDALTALTEFTVESDVATADIPEDRDSKPIFPSSIVSVNIPNVKSIGARAFMECKALTTVGIEQVTSIGLRAFMQCTSLTTIEGGEQVESIGEEAFASCEKLETASFPRATSVGPWAFDNCIALATVNIPEATSLGKGAFLQCTSLTEVSFPKVTTFLDIDNRVQSHTFSGCVKLETASFPLLTSIEGDYAFEKCKVLTTLKLGATVPVLKGGGLWFDYCPQDRRLELVDETGKELTGDALTTAEKNYDKMVPPDEGTDSDNLWYGWQVHKPVCLCSVSKPTFPDGKITILLGNSSATHKLVASGAALNGNDTCEIEAHKSISKDITYTYAVTSDSEFAKVEGDILTVTGDPKDPVTIRATATAANGVSQEAQASFTVTKETEAYKIFIKINDDQTSYGDLSLEAAVKKALNGAEISTITKLSIASGTVTNADWKYLGTKISAVTEFSIDAAVSVEEKCSFPKEIVSINIPQAIPIGNFAFRYCDKLTTVDIPNATTIGEEAFSGCTALTSVDLPKATTMGKSVFVDCTSLASIKLPEITNIGEKAFFGCTALTSVNLPKATTMGKSVFEGCTSLASIKLPEITNIGEKAFSGCTALTSVNLPKATTMDQSAFEGCTSLASIELLEITNIGENAFLGCTALTSVNLPKATTMDQSAFFGCTSLASIKLLEITKIGEMAFSGCTAFNTLTLGATVPEVFGASAFTSVPETRNLTLADKDGTPLSGAALVTAVEAYDFGEGLPKDGKWYGWKVDEPCRCTVTTPSLANDSFQIPYGQNEGTYELTATGSVWNSENCTAEGHKDNKTPTYSYAITSGSGSITGNKLTVTTVGALLVTVKAKYNRATSSKSSEAIFFVGKLNEAPAITIRVNDGKYTFGGNSLEAAIGAVYVKFSGYDQDQNRIVIKKMTITEGEVTQKDWKDFDGGRLLKLTDLTIEEGVVVADIVGPGFLSEFDRCSDLTNVTIHPAVTLGKDAFNACEKLVSVNMPNVTSIGESAFENCTALKDVYFPKVTSIGESAFENCTALKAVSFPKVTSIGAGAFLRYLLDPLDTLDTVALGAKPPILENQSTFSLQAGEIKARLLVVDDQGAPLTGETLIEAQKAYDKVVAPDIGTNVDGLWYGVKVRDAVDAEWTPTGQTQARRGSFVDALNEISKSGGTIKLIDEVSTRRTISFAAKDIHIDLNGQEWSCYPIKVPENCTLTIEDSASGGKITPLGTSDSTLSVSSGGTLDLQSGSIIGPVYGISNEGTLKISGGTVTGTKCAIYNDGGALYLSGAPTLTAGNGYKQIVMFKRTAATLIANNGKTGNELAYSTGAVSIEYGWIYDNNKVVVSGLKDETHAKLFTCSNFTDPGVWGYIYDNTTKTIKVASEVNAVAPTIKNDLSETQVVYKTGETATALSIAADVGYGGTLSYEWYSNSTNSASGGMKQNATAASYIPPTTTVGTTYYYCVVTNTNNTATGITTAAVTSKVAQIKVEPVIADSQIAIRINGGTKVGGGSLQGAVTSALDGASASTITKLSIIEGEMKEADWGAIKQLTGLTEFEIDGNIADAKVANIPSGNADSSVFPGSIVTVTIPQKIKIGSYAFYNCTKLATLKLPEVPPTVEDANAFHSCLKTTLTLINADGSDLAGDTLTAAQAQYDAVLDNLTGSTGSDGLWYGWKVRDSVTPTECTCTLDGVAAPNGSYGVNTITFETQTFGAAKFPVALAFDAVGSTIAGNCKVAGHRANQIAYTYEVTSQTPANNAAITNGSAQNQAKIVFTTAGNATVKCTATVNGKTKEFTATLKIEAKAIELANGGQLDASLTQETVDNVFGEGNAVLEDKTPTRVISINNNITLNGPIEIETPIQFQLNDITIKGASGSNAGNVGISPIIVGANVAVDIAGNGTILGGNSGAGAGGANGITGGTGSAITIGSGVTVIGGAGGAGGNSGGDGINSKGSIIAEGTIQGGKGGDGTNSVKGRSAQARISVADGGTGGNGTYTSSNDTTINGTAIGGKGGNGTVNGSGGNGGNGAKQDGGTVNGTGQVTGGDGGMGAGSGNSGKGGDGVGGALIGGSLSAQAGIDAKKATTEVDDDKAGTIVTVPDSSTLADAALTETEKKDPDITGVDVKLKVEKKNDQPNKTEVEAAMSSVKADTIGSFFDITLERTITTTSGALTPENVEAASKEIEITIAIPSDMRGGSNYVVIRVHNGIGTALETTQSGDNLTFKTDKFSTYAIAYVKAGGGAEPIPPSGGNSGPGGSHKPTVSPSDQPNTADTESAEGSKGSIFTDISGHWAKEDIAFVANRGLFSGTGANIFSPNTSMTRAMFVTALGRLAGIDSTKYETSAFTDVKADAYYKPYVAWAAAKNIVSGTTATTFAPNQAITRQEMAVMMQNYAKAMNDTVPKTRESVTFADNASMGSWAAEAIKSMQMAGVMMGKDSNRFDPTGMATRAEVSVVLHRYIELVIDKSPIN